MGKYLFLTEIRIAGRFRRASRKNEGRYDAIAYVAADITYQLSVWEIFKKKRTSGTDENPITSHSPMKTKDPEP